MTRIPLLIALVLLPVSVFAGPRRRAIQPPPRPASPVVTHSFDFTKGSALGWEAGFADFTEGMDLRTVGELRLLPPEVRPGTAWYLSGWNFSDDLFMFLRRRLDRSAGIVPHQNYIATFAITLATNAGRECGGIGGQPGESVFIKLGSSPVRPEAVLEHGYVKMNLDKGNQSQGGVHGSVAGTVSADVPLPCQGGAPFVDLVRTHTHPHAVPASADGELWLLFGTDSGFEGVNRIYVQRIDVTLMPVEATDARTRWQKTYADVAGLALEIERAGHLIREHSRGRNPMIGGRDVTFLVGLPGDTDVLHATVFDSAAEAEHARTLVSPDGRTINGVPVEWRRGPHFFMGDHFIVNYEGSSTTVLDILTQRLGAQFAGK